MKINVTLLIAILSCIIFSSQAQEKESNVELKFYYNFSRSLFDHKFPFHSDDFQYIRPEVSNNNLGEFSLGIIFNKNFPFSHELEIMPLSLNKSTLFEDNIAVDMHDWEFKKDGNFALNSRLRYQINYNFQEKTKFDFYIGFSSMLSYYHQKYGGYNSFDFQKKYNQVGIILGLTPGFKVPISDKLNFSFDVPVGIIGLNYRRLNYENPTIPHNEKIQNAFSGELWYQGFQVRAGLGFNL